MKIFFDFDGTLIDVSVRHYQVYKEVVSKLGGYPLPKDEYWALKQQKTPWPELLEKSQISRDVLHNFLQSFIEKIESLDYLKIDKLFPGALEVLRTVSEQHECYLLSLRRQHTNLLAEVEWLGIKPYFKAILTGHSESDGYDKKIELIAGRLAKNEVGIIVGDAEADIVTGKELGLITVAVLSGIRDDRFLRALHPDQLIVSIDQFPQVIAQYQSR